MIRGIHGLFYSADPEATRAFFRDTLRLPGTDTGNGWWIFDFAEADVGVHPVDEPSGAGEHDVSFYCDDIAGTVRDLKARGVEFTRDVEDHGYGLVTYLIAPGGITIQLFEPRYKRVPRATKPAAKRAAARGAEPKKRAAAKRSAPKRAAKPKRGAPKKVAGGAARRGRRRPLGTKRPARRGGRGVS